MVFTSGTALRSALAGLLAVGIGASSASAQTTPAPAASTNGQTTPAQSPAVPALVSQPALATALRGEVPAPVEFVTHHIIDTNAGRLAFTARAGEIYLRDDVGNPTAAVFSFSYFKDQPATTQRPVVFIIGGGPGSASAFLHVGLLGPWTVPMPRVAPDGPRHGSPLPPYDVADNPHTLLQVADLVFIDPVGTGYSRAVGQGRNPDFWGMDADNEANAQFIVAWLTKYGRWNSPKFFLGESYGSIRASIISNALMGGPYTNGLLHGTTLNGVMLLATVLDLGPLRNDLALTNALNLPVQANTAWYHGKADRTGKTLAMFDAEVRAFAEGPYLDALRQEAAGSLASDNRATVVAKLVAYTGLPARQFDKSLTISAHDFTRSVLADRNQVVGLYDGRFSLPARAGAEDPIGDDPALGQLFTIWTGAMETVLHDKLSVKIDRPYAEIMWRNLLGSWDMSRRAVPPGQNFADDIANTLRRTPEMRAFVSSGYFDFVTPSATARYALKAAGAPAKQYEFHQYQGGHDVYAGKDGTRLADDLVAFVTATVKVQSQ